MKPEKNNYQDIIDYTYTGSKRLNRMTVKDRAAQFAPFAALSGHGEAVAETARTVDRKIILGEDAIAEIFSVLNNVNERIREKPEVIITYFVPDCRKTGGQYITEEYTVNSIDNYKQTIILENGAEIQFDNIYQIELLN